MKILFVGSKAQHVRRADNLIAICEPIAQQCGILNISQPYRPPLPVSEIALLYFFFNQKLHATCMYPKYLIKLRLSSKSTFQYGIF
jgi:hypothetical protein